MYNWEIGFETGDGVSRIIRLELIETFEGLVCSFQCIREHLDVVSMQNTAATSAQRRKM